MKLIQKNKTAVKIGLLIIMLTCIVAILVMLFLDNTEPEPAEQETTQATQPEQEVPPEQEPTQEPEPQAYPPTTLYYDNGNKKEYTTYYSNGNKKEYTAYYDNGNKATYRTYYSNGNTKHNTGYREDGIIGSKQWWRDGDETTPYRTERYDEYWEGKLFSRAWWREDGTLEIEEYNYDTGTLKEKRWYRADEEADKTLREHRRTLERVDHYNADGTKTHTDYYNEEKHIVSHIDAKGTKTHTDYYNEAGTEVIRTERHN